MNGRGGRRDPTEALRGSVRGRRRSTNTVRGRMDEERRDASRDVVALLTSLIFTLGPGLALFLGAFYAIGRAFVILFCIGGWRHVVARRNVALFAKANHTQVAHVRPSDQAAAKAEPSPFGFSLRQMSRRRPLTARPTRTRARAPVPRIRSVARAGGRERWASQK